MKFIEDICDKIVSPPKIRYSMYDLGSLFTNSGRRYDFQTLNNRGNKIMGSYYETSKKGHQGVCVIYLHSMNGSRLQSTVYVDQILKMGVSFCNFDFTGCGNSEGNAISFGANQKHDVLAVVEKIKERFAVSRFFLWGRSMGSACAIKYCEMMHDLRWSEYRREVMGLILDSTFKSFAQLAVQIGHKHSQFPHFLIKAGYMIIKNTLEERGHFKVQQLQLEPVVGKLQVPVLFLASEDDVTISSQHSRDLFAKYKYYQKQLHYIRGLHNESRDQDYLQKVKQFIYNYLNRGIVDVKFSKWEKLMEKNRNLIVEGDQWARDNQDCSCSLFNTNSNSPRYLRDSMTTKRKNSQPLIMDKVRIPKATHPTPFSLRSSVNICQPHILQ